MSYYCGNIGNCDQCVKEYSCLWCQSTESCEDMFITVCSSKSAHYSSCPSDVEEFLGIIIVLLLCISCMLLFAVCILCFQKQKAKKGRVHVMTAEMFQQHQRHNNQQVQMIQPLQMNVPVMMNAKGELVPASNAMPVQPQMQGQYMVAVPAAFANQDNIDNDKKPQGPVIATPLAIC